MSEFDKFMRSSAEAEAIFKEFRKMAPEPENGFQKINETLRRIQNAPQLPTVVISDTHLSSDVCQAHKLSAFLDDILAGKIPAGRLIINGDLFDDLNMKRLKKSHWAVLKKLRKIAKVIDTDWVVGNHDDCPHNLSALLGINFVDELIVESGGRRIMVLHGHRFDSFIEDFPITTWVADVAYRLLQRIDRTHIIARIAKHNSKVFLRAVHKVRSGAIAYAGTKNCLHVICGHTHIAAQDEDLGYYNSGCWTEKVCHYLTIHNGKVLLHEYGDERVREANRLPQTKTSPVAG